jgi:ATP-dependent DNA helicase DinG
MSPMIDDVLAHFPPGATPRPEQVRLLRGLADAVAEAWEDPGAPRVLLVEAPPGVGKSHVAMTLARWSGDAYLLTSQKLLQDQYEYLFGADLQLVKGRDNYRCERYGDAHVPTSQGMCRRPRGPLCQCPYARAKAAALAGPIFCTNTVYFATLRQWHGEPLRRRRLLIVDEAHNLESQLVGVVTVSFPGADMRAWFGAPLPRLDAASAYRPLMEDHLVRLESRLRDVEGTLGALRPPETATIDFLRMPPSGEEAALLAERDTLETALARVRFFVEGEDREWAVRYGAGADGALELVPLSVAEPAAELLAECGEVVVLSSAFLGHRQAVAEHLGLTEEGVRVFRSGSPFELEQRPIVYRPVGRLSRATLAELEPALFGEVAAILGRHAEDKGLIHAASYAAARRLMAGLAERAPREFSRLIFVDSSRAKPGALELHRASPLPTVLVSPSLREGVDLPDDFLRFQVITKMPYPDLGDPWTAARRARDPRWYALETAKALVQAYGRSCRNAEDHGTTYILDAQFAAFVQQYRVLLPEWFLDATEPALRQQRERDP